MNITAWILSALVALVFVSAGVAKLSKPLAELLQEERWGWAQALSDAQFKALAWLELLGVAGLLVPWATGVAPVLTPMAATGLACIMAGAVVVHGRRREWQSVAINLALLVAASLVAVFRFIQL